ncbi:carboxypeptidase regulatory-like domain-containing protein [Polyangium sorediatum]|uniref:Carboxypeptidase regulatory-like domain-containing protein n=1 Tax=Polyangium sorediatum TaxID=889274 RepID=A0ABT6NW90_9BACT|nr:carboxypeptidase regulatory-like domain-containing protein [Polyangium sorediatum]MDI1432350.1 hypothetical protein [Polyangium sorediatum]
MHGKKWRISTLSDVVWIVPRLGGGAVPEGASSVARGLAAWFVDGWFPDEPRAHALVADITAFLAGPLGAREGASFTAQRARVRQALEAGELRAFKMEMQFVLAAGGRKEEPKGEKVAAREEKTWFGIELVDDDDPPKPVPFKRYRVELPDGATREGMLDAEGRARITGIDPGQCSVTFPDFHGEDWRRL